MGKEKFELIRQREVRWEQDEARQCVEKKFKKADMAKLVLSMNGVMEEVKAMENNLLISLFQS